MTRQRVIILEALCELDGHAGAESIYQKIALQRHDVDLSTVYRTLEKLCERGIVSRTDLGRGCTEYEILADTPTITSSARHVVRYSTSTTPT